MHSISLELQSNYSQPTKKSKWRRSVKTTPVVDLLEVFLFTCHVSRNDIFIRHILTSPVAASPSNHPEKLYDQASLRYTTNTLRRIWSRFLADRDGDYDIMRLQLEEYEKRDDKSEDVASMMSLWLYAFSADIDGDTDEIDPIIAQLINEYYSLPSNQYSELERVLNFISIMDDFDGLRDMALCLLGTY